MVMSFLVSCWLIVCCVCLVILLCGCRFCLCRLLVMKIWCLCVRMILVCIFFGVCWFRLVLGCG